MSEAVTLLESVAPELEVKLSHPLRAARRQCQSANAVKEVLNPKQRFLTAVLGFFFLWSFFVLILQHWDVFKYVTEVFILVPALLGLKGNLEMTLASRLSTAVSIQGMLRSRMSVFWGAGRDVHVHMNAVTTQRRGWS